MGSSISQPRWLEIVLFILLVSLQFRLDVRETHIQYISYGEMHVFPTSSKVKDPDSTYNPVTIHSYWNRNCTIREPRSYVIIAIVVSEVKTPCICFGPITTQGRYWTNDIIMLYIANPKHAIGRGLCSKYLHLKADS